MNKEEKCKILDQYYKHINPTMAYEQLIKFNDAQIEMLFTACKDENGFLRK
jgi:hypothetical protein